MYLLYGALCCVGPEVAVAAAAAAVAARCLVGAAATPVAALAVDKRWRPLLCVVEQRALPRA